MLGHQGQAAQFLVCLEGFHHISGEGFGVEFGDNVFKPGRVRSCAGEEVPAIVAFVGRQKIGFAMNGVAGNAIGQVNAVQVVVIFEGRSRGGIVVGSGTGACIAVRGGNFVLAAVVFEAQRNNLGDLGIGQVHFGHGVVFLKRDVSRFAVR